MGNYIKTIVNSIICVCSLYVERLLVEFGAAAAVHDAVAVVFWSHNGKFNLFIFTEIQLF